MADPPPYPDTSDDTVVGPDRESTTGAPRWVKVFGIIALVVALLVVVLLLAGGGPGGGHGPSRHSSSGDPDGDTPASSVAFSPMVDHTPPEGGQW